MARKRKVKDDVVFKVETRHGFVDMSGDELDAYITADYEAKCAADPDYPAKLAASFRNAKF